LFAVVASGTIWITGTSVGLRIGLVLATAAAVYVLIGGLMLALAGERTGLTSVVLWGCAVALMPALALPVAGSLAIVVGLLFGTLSFDAWMCTGFLLLHFFSHNRRTARP
jgi:hypothetical protein